MIELIRKIRDGLKYLERYYHEILLKGLESVLAEKLLNNRAEVNLVALVTIWNLEHDHLNAH